MGHWGRRWRLDQRRRRHAPRWILTLSLTTRSGGALIGGGSGGGPPYLGDSDVPQSNQKTHPHPSFILSRRPFFEVIAQGCNWIAVISATSNTKCCNLSINRGGPRQADPYAGERGGGARVWPTCGQVGRVGPGRARGGAQAWRRAGGTQAGRGYVHLL